MFHEYPKHLHLKGNLYICDNSEDELLAREHALEVVVEYRTFCIKLKPELIPEFKEWCSDHIPEQLEPQIAICATRSQIARVWATSSIDISHSIFRVKIKESDSSLQVHFKLRWSEYFIAFRQKPPKQYIRVNNTFKINRI